ncbi:MAG: Gfo/Idh/MocA family oxidoreductase [Tepidisphaeraceae bacterium]
MQRSKLKTLSTEQRPLCVAVVGCGAIARGQHLPNLMNGRGVALHSCCDAAPGVATEAAERFGAARAFTDYREAVRDPEVDVVLIATTEKIRRPIIEAAADARKAIYCEKPVAAALSDLYAIRRVVKGAGVPFCAGHNRRSSPAMIDARRLFRQLMEAPNDCGWRWEREADRQPISFDGAAGMSVRINDDWHSWKGWALDPVHAPHGPLLFEMTHFTDLCNWFIDDEPIEVTAASCGFLNHSVAIRYGGGGLANIAMFANGTFGYPKELYECFGNGGAVVVDHMVEVRTAGIADAPARTLYPMLGDHDPNVGTQGGIEGWLQKKRAACDRAKAAGDPMAQFTAEPGKGHAHALERFADEIRGSGPTVCGIDSAVQATEVAFAAIRSAEQRRPVRVDEIREDSTVG